MILRLLLNPLGRILIFLVILLIMLIGFLYTNQIHDVPMYPNAEGVTNGVSSALQGKVEAGQKVRKAYSFETTDKPEVVLDYYTKKLTSVSPNPWGVSYSDAKEADFYVFGEDLLEMLAEGHIPIISGGSADVIVAAESGANGRTRVQVIETVRYH